MIIIVAGLPGSGKSYFAGRLSKELGAKYCFMGKWSISKSWQMRNVIRERLTKPRLHSEADFRVYALVERQDEPLNIEHLVIESQYGNIDSRLTRGLDYISDSDERG